MQWLRALLCSEPCGSGTSARLTLLAADSEQRPGDELCHESVVGSVFRAWVAERTTEHGIPAVIPVMTGTAYPVGTCRFTVDPRDRLVPGFVLR